MMLLKPEYNFTIETHEENRHLLDLFADGAEEHYLELGAIDYDIMETIVAGKKVCLTEAGPNNARPVVDIKIQNEGLGKACPLLALSREDRAILPYIYYANLVSADHERTLLLTYGIVSYQDEEGLPRFAPALLIPVRIFFEEGKPCLEARANIITNPLLAPVLRERYKIDASHHDLKNVYEMDKYLSLLEATGTGLEIRFENYLTFVHLRRGAQHVNRDRFLYAHRITNPSFDDELLFSIPRKATRRDDVFYPAPFTRIQRRALASILEGHDVVITGYAQTGKSTVLLAAVVNAIARDKRVLYISNSLPTLRDVEEAMREYGLERFTLNLEPPVTSPKTISNLTIKEGIVSDSRAELYRVYDEAKAGEKILSSPIQGFVYLDCLTQLALLSERPHRAIPCGAIATTLVRTDFSRKHERIVLEPLLKIEEAFHHLHGFHSNVWNVIPWENNVKDPQVIMRLLSTYSNEFGILEKIHAYLRSNYGFKPIASLQSFRAAIRDFNALVPTRIPTLWKSDRHSLSDFTSAEALFVRFSALVHSLEDARLEESRKYDRLNEKVPDITREIASLEGKVYCALPEKEKIEAINRLLSVRSGLRKSMVTALNAVNTYIPAGRDSLARLLGIPKATTDHLLEIFDHFSDLKLAEQFEIAFLSPSLSAGVMMFQGLFNRKMNPEAFRAAANEKMALFRKESAPIDSLSKEIKDYLANFKEARGAFAGTDAEFLEALRSRRLSAFPDEIRKLFKKLHLSREDFRVLISKARDYQAKLGQMELLRKKFRANFNFDWLPSISSDLACFQSFLVSFPDYALLQSTLFPAFRAFRAKDATHRAMISDKITMLVQGLTAIRDEYQDFVALGLEASEACFKEKTLAILKEEAYLDGVWHAQDAIWSVLKIDEASGQKNARAEDFYAIKKEKDAMHALESELRDPLFAPHFGALYDIDNPEKTDLMALSRLITCFRNYVDLFREPRDVLASLDEATHLEISEQIDRASVSTEGLMTSLKTYTHYFARSGLSVYLTERLEVAKKAADDLLKPQAQKELPYYLVVARNLYDLNNLSVDIHAEETYALRPLVDWIAKSDEVEGLAEDVSWVYFNSLKRMFEEKNSFSFAEYQKTLERMLTLEKAVMAEEKERVLEAILARRSIALPSEGLWLTPEIARVVKGSREMKRLVLASTDTLRYVPLDEFSVVIIDDAHRLNDFYYARSLDQQQLIIAGDYQSFKAEVHSLINNFDASHEFQFSYRFKPTSRSLLLATQYLRLKNFGITRYGTQKDISYASRRSAFEEIVITILTDASFIRPARTDGSGRHYIEILARDFKKTVLEYAENAFSGIRSVNLILSGRRDLQEARSYIEEFLVKKGATAREKRAFRLHFLLTDEASLAERLELIAIAGAIQPTVSLNKPLVVRRDAIEDFLAEIVSQAIEGERFNLLCEDIRYEKMLMEELYSILLERKKMTIAEARNFQLNRLIFTHLSISAVPSDCNILFCSNYRGIKAKKAIGNLITQLLFVSDSVILYDGDAKKKEKSALEAASPDEFLGLLRFIKNRPPFSMDEDLFDPLASLEGGTPSHLLPYLPSAERSPYHELLSSIARTFEKLGARCYYASAPLDFLVIPQGSDVIYGVMILSPGFTIHSSLLNDYRDIFWGREKKMALRVLRMDEAAHDLAGAVKALRDSMKEEKHD